MEYIQDGVTLNDLFKDVNSGTRLLRENLSDGEIETVYRQFANFMLQLFQLDLNHIGSLEPPTPKIQIPIRPLTWKTHDILQTGVYTFDTPSLALSVRTPDRS
jgi:hypothetical protein